MKAAPLSRFFHDFVKPHRNRFLEVFLCVLVASAMRVMVPVGYKLILDEVILGRNVPLLPILALAMMAIYGVRLLFVYLYRQLMIYTGQEMLFRIRQRLFNHLQRLSLKFYQEQATGALVARLISDVDALNVMFQGGMANMFSGVFLCLLGVPLLYYLSPGLCLFTLLIVPVYALALSFFMRRIRRRSRAVREQTADFSGKLTEVIQGNKTVKIFAAEDLEKHRFSRVSHRSAQLNADLLDVSSQMNVMSEGGVGLCQITVYGVGAWMVLQGRLSIGSFVAFASYMRTMFQPVNVIMNQIGNVVQASAAVERIYQVLDEEPDIEENGNGIVLTRVRGRIRFDNVSFAYERDGVACSAIRNLSFSVQPGETVALVGVSGSGKSTIANLIARFYDVDKGTIYIDDVDLRDLKLSDYRAHLGFVLQDSFLFSGSIIDNIRYGRRDASQEDVTKAAKQAYADMFIQELPDGYETVVGENGVYLSGGQKQRIAIARTLLKNPAVLILDEATSALDVESESHVQRAIERLRRGRTCIVIAHRLSTVRRADRILVLDGGRIVQSGPHRDLMQLPGPYRDFYLASMDEAYCRPAIAAGGTR